MLKKISLNYWRVVRSGSTVRWYSNPTKSTISTGDVSNESREIESTDINDTTPSGIPDEVPSEANINNKINNKRHEEIKPPNPNIFKSKIKHQESLYLKNLPEWVKRDKAIKHRYGKWNPTKKLSRQQIEYLRTTSELMPHLKTVDLASMFNVSPENIRRILKSKWVPNDDEIDKVVKREETRRLLKKQWNQNQKHDKKSVALNSKPKDSSVEIINLKTSHQRSPNTNIRSDRNRKPNKFNDKKRNRVNNVNRVMLSIDEIID